MVGNYPSPTLMSLEQLIVRGDRAMADWREAWRGAQEVFGGTRELLRKIDEIHHRPGSDGRLRSVWDALRAAGE